MAQRSVDLLDYLQSGKYSPQEAALAWIMQDAEKKKPEEDKNPYTSWGFNLPPIDLTIGPGGNIGGGGTLNPPSSPGGGLPSLPTPTLPTLPSPTLPTPGMPTGPSLPGMPNLPGINPPNIGLNMPPGLNLPVDFPDLSGSMPSFPPIGGINMPGIGGVDLGLGGISLPGIGGINLPPGLNLPSIGLPPLDTTIPINVGGVDLGSVGLTPPSGPSTPPFQYTPPSIPGPIGDIGQQIADMYAPWASTVNFLKTFWDVTSSYMESQRKMAEHKQKNIEMGSYYGVPNTEAGQVQEWQYSSPIASALYSDWYRMTDNGRPELRPEGTGDAFGPGGIYNTIGNYMETLYDRALATKDTVTGLPYFDVNQAFENYKPELGDLWTYLNNAAAAGEEAKANTDKQRATGSRVGISAF